jgi:hypothetical protein
MKTIVVRVSDEVVAQIEAEARARKMSKSDIVRDRLTPTKPRVPTLPASLDDIADLIGSVDGLPADLSSNHKRYLRAGYGRKRSR